METRPPGKELEQKLCTKHPLKRLVGHGPHARKSCRKIMRMLLAQIQMPNSSQSTLQEAMRRKIFPQTILRNWIVCKMMRALPGAVQRKPSLVSSSNQRCSVKNSRWRQWEILLLAGGAWKTSVNPPAHRDSPQPSLEKGGPRTAKASTGGQTL
ncbi:UNVERIFIED_CONTAM: hypothetical protein K2H54_062566 [Gekko kuhli]